MIPLERLEGTFSKHNEKCVTQLHIFRKSECQPENKMKATFMKIKDRNKF